MFTINQIKEAHSNIKSGSGFPKYIQDIIVLGVISFETFVTDNHTNYYGKDNFKISSEAVQNKLMISSKLNINQFKIDLKEHQKGKTDYTTFLADCAKNGIQKWVVAMDKMTCTYYNIRGEAVLIEEIPTL